MALMEGVVRHPRLELNTDNTHTVSSCSTVSELLHWKLQVVLNEILLFLLSTAVACFLVTYQFITYK